MFNQKEASGLRLFYWLHGVQVAAGSNPAAPTLCQVFCEYPALRLVIFLGEAPV